MHASAGQAQHLGLESNSERYAYCFDVPKKSHPVWLQATWDDNVERFIKLLANVSSGYRFNRTVRFLIEVHASLDASFFEPLG